MESGGSIRCDAQRWTAALQWAGMVLVVVASASSSAAYALKGKVIDGSTGKPLAGVYVFGAWDVSTPMPVQSRSACARLDLRRTDDAGTFTLPNHSGRFLSWVLGTESLNVYYYKPDYRFDHGREWLAEPVAMVRDTRGIWARFDELGSLMTHADCGSDDESRRNRLILYRAIYNEAVVLAVTLEERIAAAKLLYWIDAMELGEDRAIQNLERRRREEREKK